MKALRYLLWMVLVPGTALAANPNWVRLGSTADCGALARGSICSFQWTTAANANSTYLQTGSRPFTLRFEPDKDGSTTDAEADVYACTSPTANACRLLLFADTDNDGILDSAELSTATAVQLGTPVMLGIPWIYIDPTTNPTSGTAEVIATGEAGE